MTDPRAQHNRNPNSDDPDYPETYGGDCPLCGEPYGKLSNHILLWCEESNNE